jgi:hypothetical protein
MSLRHALHTDQTSSFGGDMPEIVVESMLVDALQDRRACRECAWRALEIHQLTRRAVSQTAAKGGLSSLEPRLH